MTATMQPKSEAAEAPRRGKRTPGTGENTPPRRGPMQFGHWWWALPGIALVFAIHYVATGIGGFFAFTNWTGIGSFKITGWTNFEAIFKDPTKLGALSNTLFLAFGSVLLGNIAGLVIALGLNRVVKTRYILRTLFFMPVVLSPLATAYIWKYIFDFDGPLNAFLTAIGAGDQAKPWLADPQWAIWTVLVVLVWSSTGFAMVIFMAGLAGVPVEVEEAPICGSGSATLRCPPSAPPSPSPPRWESSKGCASSIPSWRSPAADRPERRKRWPRWFTSRPLRSGTSGAVPPWPWCSPPSS